MFLTMTMALTATVMIGFGHPLPLMNHLKNKNLDTSHHTDVAYMPSQRNNVTSNNTETTSSLETLDKNTTLFMDNIHGTKVAFACLVSLCAVDQLAHTLSNGGDEVAGHNTRDPLGPGK